jgi:hypothetical protein
MSFLAPAFLLAALTVAVPIALHVRRRHEAPEVPFTAVRFLEPVSRERARGLRLRDPLLLAARMTAILLAAAAFARPVLTGAGDGHALRIVAIDRSYSMGAEGQVARMRALARGVIDAAPRGARLAVVGFDDRAEVVAGPGTAAEARAAIENLEPGYGGTRYAALIARVIDLAGTETTDVDIITDMQRAGWEGAGPLEVPPHVRIRLHPVELPVSNIAVTAVRRDESGIAASIEHVGEGTRHVVARLLLDGQPAAESRLTLPPGATTVTFQHAVPGRGGAAVEIDDPAGLVADDTRHLLLDPAPFARVLVVAEQADGNGFYLRHALEAAGEAGSVRRATPAEVGRLAPDEWRTIDAIALLSTRGLDRRGREAVATFVNGGGGLLVAAGESVDPALVGSIVDGPDIGQVATRQEPAALTVTDLRHPIFQPLAALVANMGDVRADRYWMLPEAGWDVVARFDTGVPALVERRQGSGRLLLFASDLDRRWNDFPRHPAFVVFALESLRHVSDRLALPREYVVAEAPAGAGPPPGIYTLADGRQVAVNVDLRERTLASMTADQFLSMLRPAAAAQGPVARGIDTQREARQGLWRYAILLLAGVLLTESFLGRPR